MKTSFKTISDAGSGLIFSYEPVYDLSSRVLILGTMASPASLRAGFYYGHPQNSFWRIISALTVSPLPYSTEEKREMLLLHGVALWDTLKCCERSGAADSNILHEMPNDVGMLVKSCPNINAVFLNGASAYGFYKKYHSQTISLPFYPLPSTSPANARGGYENKLAAWQAIAEYLI
jgi:hypoxanthine-DNA glycosylase